MKSSISLFVSVVVLFIGSVALSGNARADKWHDCIGQCADLPSSGYEEKDTHNLLMCIRACQGKNGYVSNDTPPDLARAGYNKAYCYPFSDSRAPSYNAAPDAGISLSK